MKTIYDFSLSDKKGNEVKLSEYKGKVLLIVNTATECGFTPQYEELEAMYGRLKDKDFEILDNGGEDWRETGGNSQFTIHNSQLG